MINYEKNLGTYSLRCYLWSDVCEKVWKYFDPTVFTTYRVKKWPLVQIWQSTKSFCASNHASKCSHNLWCGKFRVVM